MANETMQWPNPGLGSVGSYQMGGIPYVSSSITVPANSSTPLKIQFPYVIVCNYSVEKYKQKWQSRFINITICTNVLVMFNWSDWRAYPISFVPKNLLPYS